MLFDVGLGLSRQLLYYQIYSEDEFSGVVDIFSRGPLPPTIQEDFLHHDQLRVFSTWKTPPVPWSCSHMRPSQRPTQEDHWPPGFPSNGSECHGSGVRMPRATLASRASLWDSKLRPTCVALRTRNWFPRRSMVALKMSYICIHLLHTQPPCRPCICSPHATVVVVVVVVVVVGVLTTLEAGGVETRLGGCAQLNLPSQECP